MIIFDQLRISDDGRRLYINVHVNAASYFEDVTLDSITVIPAMSSDKHIQITETDCTPPTENYIYKKIYGDGVKYDDIVLDKTILIEAFNNTNSEGNPKQDGATAKASYEGYFSNDLIFVYVKCKIPANKLNPCVPCDSDSALTTVGVTFDSALLYQRVMDFTKQLADDCIIPLGFTDYILLWNAFKAAIDTEHWVPAVKYWNMLFGIGENGESYGPYGSGTTVGRSRRGCGCHG